MSFAVVLRLLAVMVLWALCFPLITVGLDLAPHLAFAAMRAALAGACLLVFGLAFRRPIPHGASNWILVALTGLGATSLGFIGMFHAAEFVSPGLATVVANAQPLLTAVLAHLFLNERLNTMGKIGLTAGMAGIVAIAWPSLAAGRTEGIVVGIAYIGLATAGIAGGNIAIKRLTGRVDAMMATGFQLLIGAVPLAVLSTLTENVTSLTWSNEFVLILVALSVFGTALASWLWFGALEQVNLNRANAFTFLVPIFGLTIGATLFAERLTWIQGVGVMLVLLGIGLAQDKARIPLGSAGS